MATVVDSTDLSHFHPSRKVCWTGQSAIGESVCQLPGFSGQFVEFFYLTGNHVFSIYFT